MKLFKIWEGGGVDSILMPGYQGVAPRHYKFGIPVYTLLVNLLNWPSGILTTGKAEKDLDVGFAKEGTQYEPPCKSVSMLRRRDGAN